ncbi:nucleotidyltransferase family protein [Consotaella aegiceratis]|uniref:nucleotidyltransferase family protein n=1 Tax=Consotaella aegiceratis TaxID=3097961 RepID=UPI002F426D64
MTSRRPRRVAAVILAAGRSTRMGDTNKLLAPLAGRALVRHVAEAALASRAQGVFAVVGHRRDDVAAALSDLDLTLVDNPAYAEGLATSLIAGYRAAAGDADGVLVLLGDQPLVGSGDLDAMIDAFTNAEADAIVAASHGGRRGNPVLLPTVYAAEVLSLTGDVGARDILAAHRDRIRLVKIGPAAVIDVDTPEALDEVRRTVDRT